MKFEKIKAYNFAGAIRGMRNPLESWDKSDSAARYKADSGELWQMFEYDELKLIYDIGPRDMKLAQRLIKGGGEHRKFLRQILVSLDITAPLYWWKEMDTYTTGIVKNSTSTMHKIMARPFTLDLFEMDDFDQCETEGFLVVLDTLNKRRGLYLLAKNVGDDKAAKVHWKAIIRLLPESWLQKRTVTLNYENIRNIVHQRKGHKLTEWAAFIDAMRVLPYAEELIFFD